MVGSGDKQSSGGSAQAMATGGTAAHDTSGAEWGSTLSGPKAANDGAAKLRIELFGSGLTSAVRHRPRAPLPLSRSLSPSYLPHCWRPLILPNDGGASPLPSSPASLRPRRRRQPGHYVAITVAGLSPVLSLPTWRGMGHKIVGPELQI